MDAKKEQIADSFQKHFTHFGYKKTSVDDVAKELGISKKTVYQFFSTKEEVFYYIVSRIARQYVRKMESKLASLPTCREKLGQLVRMIFAESRQWLRGNDAFEFKYKYEISELAFQDAYRELIQRLIQGGVEAGEFVQVPVETTTRFVQGIISESMRALQADKTANVEDETIAAILKLLR
jgi:AcrR family transcriptional regulator